MKAIALLVLSSCAVDVELDTATQEATTATFKLLGKPQVAPIDGFEIFADKIIYIGYSAGESRAIEVSSSLVPLRSSPALPSSTAPNVNNLATNGNYVVFGDGARNTIFSLAGFAPRTVDTTGVFGKGIYGHGGVLLQDGTLARIMTAEGYAPTAWSSPVQVDSVPQPAAKGLLSQSSRQYVTPNGRYLRFVNLPTSGSPTVSHKCSAGTSTYSTKSLASAHDAAAGTYRLAALTTDGKLVDCTGSSTTGSNAKITQLPWAGGDLALEGGGGINHLEGGGGIGLEGGGGIQHYEGGGGLGYEGGGGLGIWVAAASVPEVAYVSPSGAIARFPLTTKFTSAYIPKHIRSLGDGSAIVQLADGNFVQVTRN